MLTRLIATFFGAGLSPVAPGTAGSLAALPVGYLLWLLGGPWMLLTGAVIAYFAGLWATDRETAGQSNHDPSYIVIDEVAGQWLAMLPFAIGLSPFLQGGWGGHILALLLAFLLFRAFDILKPFPVSWADNMNTPLGVMLDDVLAGLMAAVVVVVLHFAIGGT